MIYAFSEQGHPAAVGAYTSSAGSFSGAYRLKGLWPGTYRMLAVSIRVNSNRYVTQWYPGLDVPPDSVMQVPMPLVPASAQAVVVAGGTTPNIDFYLELTTEVSSDPSLQPPKEYVLEQNYPNPFNPSTRIGYGVSGAGGGESGVNTGGVVRGKESSWIKLAVYDLLGREVTVLVDEPKAPGSYEVVFNAAGLSTGVYFYRMTVGSPSGGSREGFVQTRRLLLLR